MRPPPIRTRLWWLLLPILIAASLASWWLLRPAPGGEVAAAAAVGPVTAAAPIAPMVAAAAAPVAVAEPAAAPAVADIFAARTWEPPPPPAAAKTSSPQAPPLPFRFLGRIAEPATDGKFMLSDGQRVLVVGIGDMIGSNYVVEKYENGQLLFRYRPMNLRQALDVGDKS